VGHDHQDDHIADHKQNHRGCMTGGKIALTDLSDPVSIGLNCVHDRVHGYSLFDCWFDSFFSLSLSPPINKEISTESCTAEEKNVKMPDNHVG
jgi:hypothetical protein